jgi:hypothetical protein
MAVDVEVHQIGALEKRRGRVRNCDNCGADGSWRLNLEMWWGIWVGDKKLFGAKGYQ